MKVFVPPFLVETFDSKTISMYDAVFCRIRIPRKLKKKLKLMKVDIQNFKEQLREKMIEKAR